MVEGTKQVRVDNWGVFFLQRLQMFFNKTDYCDLTLQFEGNVQLKVHRLVINACTEYFNYLEQTCVVHGDVLIMPPDLQADVVLPIVNFMYTGMLEFHTSIFEKLYKTAELMNITVLTKLLDALRNPMQTPQKLVSKKKSPQLTQFNTSSSLPSKKAIKTEAELPAPLPGRKLPVWKRKTVPNPAAHVMWNNFPETRKPVDPLAIYDSTPKPTRFEWPEEELSTFNLFDSSFDDISYTSKPLLTQEYEPKPSTSFEKIRDFSERKSPSNFHDDVKELKEPRRRSNLTEFNVDCMENNSELGSDKIEGQKRKMDEKADITVTKKVRFNVNEKENQNSKTKLNISPVGKTSPDLNHSKIISEVLKRYPHIVKKNKNIKLKILAKNSNMQLMPDKIQTFKTSTSAMRIQVVNASEEKKPSTSDKKEEGPWRCLKCSTPTEPMEFILYYLYRKHMTDVHNEKFDSRMCKYCGHKCSKHNMLMYHQYTKHGIKPPPAYNFPKCNQCPYIALTENLLIKHKLNHTKFDLQCPDCKVAFNNQHSLSSHVRITGHTGKCGRSNFDCQYCTKKYHTAANLFSHIKMQHRDEARRDGVVSVDEIDADAEDFEDEETDATYNEQMDQRQEGEEEREYINSEMMSEKKEKIKILSNVKVDSKQDQASSQDQHDITLQHSSESEALTNVASGIATSLGLVDIVVLDDNQQYILHSNNQHLTPTSSHSSSQSQSEFILPELTDTHPFTSQQANDQSIINQSMLNSSDIGSTDELVMVLTDHDYGDGNNDTVSNDSSNIVVLYSHPAVGNEGQFITTSQGNIMINSETGVFELRNSESFVPISESSVLVAGSGAQPASPHIESIEMIQREIDSHSKDKTENNCEQDVKPILAEPIKTNENNEQVYLQHSTVENVVIQPDQNIPEEVHIQQKQQESINVQVQSEQVAEITQNENNTPESQLEALQPEENISEEKQNPVSESSNNDVEIADKEVTQDTAGCAVQTDICLQGDKENKEPVVEVMEVDENPTNEENEKQTVVEEIHEEPPHLQNNECLSDAPMLTHRECYINENSLTDQITEEEPKENLRESPTSIEGVKEESQETSKEKKVVDKIDKIEDVLQKNATEETESKSQSVQEESTNINNDDKECEDKMEEQCTEIIIDETEYSLEEARNNEEEETNERPSQEEMNTSQDANISCGSVETEEDISQKINNDPESEVSQTSSEKESKNVITPKIPLNNPSAKTILDEWEDTDSQQSSSGNTEIEASNSSTVHKLIDDWEDEEEEDNRKTV